MIQFLKAYLFLACVVVLILFVLFDNVVLANEKNPAVVTSVVRPLALAIMKRSFFYEVGFGFSGAWEPGRGRVGVGVGVFLSAQGLRVLRLRVSHKWSVRLPQMACWHTNLIESPEYR